MACAPPEEADATDTNSNMILPKVRDPRFVTIRRGGTLTDSDHHLLALWAASCAEHVLDLFELAEPKDARPRQAIEHARAWVRGEVTMTQARAAGGHAMGAARDLRGAARHAAYAAGQAGTVAHVAAHELGAAAYAIKAARAAAPRSESEAAGRRECRWQRGQLPEAIRELVLDDQRLRNEICWSVFDGWRVATPGPAPKPTQADTVNLLVRLNLGNRNACPIAAPLRDQGPTTVEQLAHYVVDRAITSVITEDSTPRQARTTTRSSR